MGTISIDPIGIEAGDPNFYRYVGNSPTNATDPLGLDAWKWYDYASVGVTVFLDAVTQFYSNSRLEGRIDGKVQKAQEELVIRGLLDIRRARYTDPNIAKSNIHGLAEIGVTASGEVLAGSFIVAGPTRLAVSEAIEDGALSVLNRRQFRGRFLRTLEQHQHHVFTDYRAAWFRESFDIDVDDYLIDIDVLTHDALHAGKGLADAETMKKSVAGWWDDELMRRIRKARAAKGWEAGLDANELTRDEVLEIGDGLLHDILDVDLSHAHKKR